MPSSADQHSKIVAAAHWEPELLAPEPKTYDVHPNVKRKILDALLGLNSVTLTAHYRDPETGQKRKDKIQRLTVPKSSAKTVPSVDLDEICQCLYHRANTYIVDLLMREAVAPGSDVRFAIYLYPVASSETKQSQTGFTLTALREDFLDDDNGEDGDDDPGDDGEDGDDGDGDDGDGDDGDGDDGDGDDGDGDGEVDSDEERHAQVSRRHQLTARARAAHMPTVAPEVEIRGEGFRPRVEEPRDPPPGLEPPPRGRPVEGPPRGLRIGREEGEPTRRFGRMSAPGFASTPGHNVTPQTEFAVVQLVERLAEMMMQDRRATMDQYAHMLAEGRADRQAARAEYSAIFKDARVMLDHARQQSDRANERLFELANIGSKHIENQSAVNNMAWEALKSAISINQHTVTDKMSDQQRMHAVEMDYIEARHRMELARERDQLALGPAQPEEKPSARRGFMNEVGWPLTMAITSSVLESQGNGAAARMISGIAKDYFGMDNAVDDDDDEDEASEPRSGVVDVPPPPRGRGARSKPKGPDRNSQDPPAHLLGITPNEIAALHKQRPLVCELRLLHVWLEPEQRAQISEILGERNYKALVAASKAPKDTAAILKLAPLRTALGGDDGPEVRARVEAVLGEGQRELLNDLLTRVDQMISS